MTVEKFRTYVVKSFVDGGSVVFGAPKGRAFRPITIAVLDLPKRLIRGLKLGKKVEFVRITGRTYTQYVPKH